MPKFLTQFVALLLVPCLLADSTFAAILHDFPPVIQDRLMESKGSPDLSHFDQEALAGMSVFMQTLWRGGVRHVRRTIVDEDRLTMQRLGNRRNLFDAALTFPDHSFWLGQTFPFLDRLKNFLGEIASANGDRMFQELPGLELVHGPFGIDPILGIDTVLHEYGFSEARRIRLPDGHEIILVRDADPHAGASQWVRQLLEKLGGSDFEVPLEFNADLPYDRHVGLIPEVLFYALTPDQQVFVLEHERLALGGLGHEEVIRRQGVERHRRMVSEIRARLLARQNELLQPSPQDDASWTAFLDELNRRGYRWHEETLSREDWIQSGLDKTDGTVTAMTDQYEPDCQAIKEFYATFYPRAEVLLRRAADLTEARARSRKNLPEAGQLAEDFGEFLKDYKAWATAKAGSDNPQEFLRLFAYENGLVQSPLHVMAANLGTVTGNKWIEPMRASIVTWRADFEHIRRYSLGQRTTPGITLHLEREPVEHDTPRPASSAMVPPRNIEEWITSTKNDSDLTRRKTAIQDRLMYISQAVFEEKLGRLVQTLNRRLTQVPSYGVVFDFQPHRSKHWVYSLALANLQKHPSLEIFGDEEFFEKVTKWPPVLVIFDDMAITGMDMSAIIQSVKEHARGSTIIVAVPFLTRRSERRLKSMQGVELLYDEHGAPMYDLVPTLGVNGLAYFDHKIPDWVSLPVDFSDEFFPRDFLRPYRDDRTVYFAREEAEFQRQAAATKIVPDLHRTELIATAEGWVSDSGNSNVLIPRPAARDWNTISQQTKDLTRWLRESGQSGGAAKAELLEERKLRLVRQSDFEERIKKMVGALNKRLEGVSRYAVLFDDRPFKSKRWTYYLAKPFLSKAPAIAIHSDNVHLDKMTDFPGVVVIFDDLSGSGSQLLGLLTDVLRRFPQTHIILAIPFISEPAEDEVISKFPEVELLHHADGSPAYERIEAYGYPGVSLTFFDHKIPDYKTLPEWLGRFLGAENDIPPYSVKGTPYWLQEYQEYYRKLYAGKRPVSDTGSSGPELTHEDTYRAWVVYATGGDKNLREWVRLGTQDPARQFLMLRDALRELNERYPGLKLQPTNIKGQMIEKAKDSHDAEDLLDEIQQSFAPEFEQGHFWSFGEAIRYAKSHGQDVFTRLRVVAASGIVVFTWLGAGFGILFAGSSGLIADLIAASHATGNLHVFLASPILKLLAILVPIAADLLSGGIAKKGIIRYVGRTFGISAHGWWNKVASGTDAVLTHSETEGKASTSLQKRLVDLAREVLPQFRGLTATDPNQLHAFAKAMVVRNPALFGAGVNAYGTADHMLDSVLSIAQFRLKRVASGVRYRHPEVLDQLENLVRGDPAHRWLIVVQGHGIPRQGKTRFVNLLKNGRSRLADRAEIVFIHGDQLHHAQDVIFNDPATETLTPIDWQNPGRVKAWIRDMIRRHGNDLRGYGFRGNDKQLKQFLNLIAGRKVDFRWEWLRRLDDRIVIVEGTEIGKEVSIWIDSGASFPFDWVARVTVSNEGRPNERALYLDIRSVDDERLARREIRIGQYTRQLISRVEPLEHRRKAIWELAELRAFNILREFAATTTRGPSDTNLRDLARRRIQAFEKNKRGTISLPLLFLFALANIPYIGHSVLASADHFVSQRTLARSA